MRPRSINRAPSALAIGIGETQLPIPEFENQFFTALGFEKECSLQRRLVLGVKQGLARALLALSRQSRLGVPAPEIT